MAISLPDSNTSYQFQTPQQHAIHLRLTPEIKEALLRAKQLKETASLQLTGHAADNALTIGGQSFALSAPISQERLDIFKLSQQGCMQLGQIHQKTVVKRSNLQSGQRQQAQPSQHVHAPDLPHVKGATQNGFSQPQIQPAKSRTQQQPHVKALNGPAPLQPVAVPRPAKEHASNQMPAAKPAWPPTHAQQAPHHSQQQQHLSSSGLPGHAGIQKPQHAQRLSNGSQHSHQPAAEAQPHQHPTAGVQSRLGVPLGSTAVVQANQSAPPNSSLESAQTALPQNALLQKQPNKGKPHKAPVPTSALSDEVIQQVCAAAKLGQKETVLIALLQCKPCKNQVLEAVLKDAERRVPGFQRLQGESLKRACRTYGEMKPGNKWALQSQYLQPALDILTSIQSGLGTGRRHDEQPAQKRKRSAEPQAAPNSWQEAAPATQEEAQKAKKKKRLTKAGEMDRGSQSEESDKPAQAGVKRSLQAAGLDASDAEDSGQHGSAGLQPRQHDRAHVGAPAPGQHPKPARHQRSASPVDSQQWQPALHGRMTPATAGEQRRVTTATAAEQRHMDAATVGHNRSREEGAELAFGGQLPAGAFLRRGNLTGNLTGLNTDVDGNGAEGVSTAPAGADAAAPPHKKIKLKMPRRPVSASSDCYDESWYTEHLDRQPEMQGPIADLAQWEACLSQYEGKRATYFRLHQEIQDTKLKIEGLQQAVRSASDEPEQGRLKKEFESLWGRRSHRAQRWDKAFKVLHQELQALFTELQSYYSTHAHDEQGDIQQS